MDSLVLLSFVDTIKEKVFGVTNTVDLLFLGVKLVILLFIVSYVRGHFGGGPVVTILTLILGYIILFQNWMIFGPLMILYLFIVFGFTALLMDLAIVKPWRKSPEAGEPRDSASYERVHEGRRGH
ncbi:hypothetical protein HYS54_03575 [Candidatus Micrarchaeota archaeon]|nr:hypothetical protein [Candidatus Micrarchaeota archaeon]